MPILSLILLLLSNFINLIRNKSILYSGAIITILAITALITYDNLNFLLLGTVLCLTQSTLKKLYAFNTNLPLRFVLLALFNRVISLFYPFISKGEPKVHGFADVPLQSATVSFEAKREYAKLLEYQKECKDEWTDADRALKDLEKAINLDKVLPDKSQNKSMKDIMNHYKEYFDEESGNSKIEGLKQVYGELINDRKVAHAEYVKAKQKVDAFDFNSQYITPIFSLNFGLTFWRYLLPYISLLISMLLLVISIVFTFDFNIDLYIPYLLLQIRDFLQEFFVYEIIWTLPISMWSYYRLCKNTKRCFKIGKTITDFIHNSTYNKKLILPLKIFVTITILMVFILIYL